MVERKFVTEVIDAESGGVIVYKDQLRIVGHLAAVCEAVEV